MSYCCMKLFLLPTFDKLFVHTLYYTAYAKCKKQKGTEKVIVMIHDMKQVTFLPNILYKKKNFVSN